MTSWRTNVRPRWLACLAAWLPWCLNILTPVPEDGRTMFRIFDVLQYLTCNKNIMLVAVSDNRCRAHIHQSPCFFSRLQYIILAISTSADTCYSPGLRDNDCDWPGVRPNRLHCSRMLTSATKMLQSPFKIKPLHDSVLTFGSITMSIVDARTRTGAWNVRSMYI